MKWMSKYRGCCGPMPQRYVTIVMAALGLSFVFILRNSFSLALTQMVIKKNITETNNTDNVDIVCPRSEDVQEEIKKMPGEFNWTQHDTQYLISGYFYGYVLAHLPGGVLGDIMGAKIVLNIGLLTGGLCALLTPICARINFWLLFLVRIIMGLGHGVIFPGLSALVAMWAPPSERALMSVMTHSGIMFGSAAGISLTGLILGKLPGWEPPFYIFGGLMIIWNAAFYIVGYSSPAQHPFIKEDEQTRVKEAIQAAYRKKPDFIPWRSILLSPQVISLILIMTGHSWMIFFIGVQLPIYVKNVLHFNIIGSGISAALPYLAMWSTGILAGSFSDWTARNNILSTTNNRKMFALLGNFLPVPFFLGASYAGCDKNVATALFTIMMFFKGMAYASIMVNAVDLSPNYAGLVMGMANGGSAIGGLLIPFVVNFFIPDNKGASLSEWRKVFFFSTGVLVLLTLPFAFFGSGKEQPWNTVGMEEETGQPSQDHPPQPPKPT